jgi:hypothetical protein
MSNESISSNETDDLPAMHRHERGDNSIRGNSAPVATGGAATVNDRLGVYIAVVAVILSGIAVGYEMAQSSSRAEMRELQNQAIEARIQAGAAQAEATAREARTTAKTTEDKLYELRDALNAKGMNIPKLDGH